MISTIPLQTSCFIPDGFIPRSQGYALDTSPESFGELQCSAALLGNGLALQERMQRNGYLFVRGFFERDEVLAARRTVIDRMEKHGWLDPDTNPMEGVLRPGTNPKFAADLADKNAELQKVLYQGRIMDFYRSLLGEEVLHYDFTWFRAIGKGHGTKAHCDVVYMGRGTRTRLFTAWVPIGDVPIDLGGLMLLEGSHLQQKRLQHYLSRDVDSYCVNGRHAREIESGRKVWEWDGSLAKNPVSLREKLGGRWLTAGYQAGDLLTFPMHMVHASLDNPTSRVRLSSDSRYQAASEPADERWMGEKPIAHSLAGKKGRIC